MMYRRPWELVSETLMQYRMEEADDLPHWVPPMVPSQNADPLAGAYTPLMETRRVPNNKALNASFRNAQRAGMGDIQPHTGTDYMVPPKFGWRSEEIGIVDIMSDVMSRLDDPANPKNAVYLDDFSGQNGGYEGDGNTHNSMSIPQGL